MHVVNGLVRGGLENGLVNLISRLDSERFEHVVCTLRGLGPNAERLTAAGVHVECLARAGKKSRVQTPALVRAMRRLQPDIVHSRNWAAIEGALAGRLARVSSVVHSEHGFDADIGAHEPWRRTCFRRMAFELSDRVLTVSYQLRDLHSKRTRFPASRISVIHNGVDRTRYYPDAAERVRIRRELGITDTEFCIGCVANLFPVKDHVTLLEAVTRMARAHEDCRLLVIGEGPERARLESFMSQHAEWKHRVHFMGSRSDVPALLRALDVFVLPSLAEGICNALLEAMATGVSVVATAVGGTPEIIVDGESGFLVPPRNAEALAQRLIDLRQRPELRMCLGQRGLERVRDEFSIDAMVRSYDELYGSLWPAASMSVARVS
jgi:sugar transferase (PEP-CTERM/EpsH1 system associated)